MQNPQVNITRRYYCSQEKLWSALSEGFLFIYTGAIKETLKSEFKVGGKIHIEWKDASGSTMDGEYTEITPQSKIVFTWVVEVSSKVFLEIKNQGEYCELNLRHEFYGKVDVKDYDYGWDDAMLDLKKHLYK